MGPGDGADFSARDSCVCFRGALDYAAVVLTRFDDCAFVAGNYAVVDGGDGDDVVILGGGPDGGMYGEVRGGAGDDAITLLQSGYAVDADTSVYARAYGGAGDDAIVARGDVAFVDGGPGDDAIVVAPGTDAAMIGGHVVFGGDGGDAITLAAVKDAKVFGGDGGDNVIVATDSAGLQVSGGDGDDAFELTRVDDSSVDGLEGDDVVSLVGSYNQAYGGGGSDVLYLGAGDENDHSGFDDVRDAAAFGAGEGEFVGAAGPSCDSKKGRDSKSWLRKENPTKNCKWVKQKPSTRCRKKDATGARAESECVRACGSCPTPGACADDPMWSRANKKNKEITCAKVARNPARRCGMDGARDACAKTCGACEATA